MNQIKRKSNKINHTIFLFTFLLFYFILFSSVFNIIPAKSEEWENIDSMNSNPYWRWTNGTETSNPVFTVENSFLEINDSGSIGEQFVKYRQLAKTDLKMEGRLKTPVITDFPSFTEDLLFPNASDNDLLVYTKFDSQSSGTGDVIDSSMYSRSFTETWNGSSEFNDTSFHANGNYSVYLDNQTQFTIPDDDAMENYTEFSIGCWFNFDLFPQNSYLEIFAKQWFWALRIRNSSATGYQPKVEFRTFQYEGGASWYSETNLTLNTWYWVVCQYNSSDMEIYINGAFDTNITLTPAQDPYSTVTKIGDYNNYEYRVDEIFYYNSSQDPDDISTVYDAYLASTTGNETVRSIIGISNVEKTIDLAKPELAFILETIRHNDTYQYVKVYYAFTDIDDNLHEINFFNISSDTYYRWKFKANIFKSTAEWEFETDDENGIDDSEQTILDIHTTAIPKILSSEVLNIFFGNYFLNSCDFTWYIDFIKASYEEFKWDLIFDSTLAASFSSYNEFGASITMSGGWLFAMNMYALPVPQFDSLSGVFYGNTNVTTEEEMDSFEVYQYLGVIPINRSSGAANQSLSLSLQVGYQPVNFTGINTWLPEDADPSVHIYRNSTPLFTDPDEIRFIDRTEFQRKFEVPFTFYVTPNKILLLQVNIAGEIFNYETNCTGYSDEFIVYTGSVAKNWNDSPPTNDIARFSVGLKDFEWIYRGLFGILPDLPDIENPIGSAVDAGKNLLTQGLKMISGVIDSLGAIIVAPLNVIIQVLQPILTAVNTIQGILSTVSGVVSSISTTVGTISTTATSSFNKLLEIANSIAGVLTDTTALVTSVATILSDVAAIAGDIPSMVSDLGELLTTITGDVVTFLGDIPDILTELIDMAVNIATELVDAFIAAMVDFIDEIITVLISLISDVADFLIGLVVWIWDNTIVAIFPQVNDFIDGFINAIFIMMDWIWWVITNIEIFYALFVVLLTIWIFALTTASNFDDPMGWVVDMGYAMLVDASGGLSLLGFRIPVPLVLVWGLGAVYFGWEPFPIY